MPNREASRTERERIMGIACDKHCAPTSGCRCDPFDTDDDEFAEVATFGPRQRLAELARIGNADHGMDRSVQTGSDRQRRMDQQVAGRENPIGNGIVDRAQQVGERCFGGRQLGTATGGQQVARSTRRSRGVRRG